MIFVKYGDEPAPFVGRGKIIDGNKRSNGRKRYILVDALGLAWAVVIHSADVHDGKKAYLLLQHLLDYLPRMKKILVDQAHKKCSTSGCKKIL